MQGKKILYVITSGNLGGAQTHLFELISCLPESNEVHVAMGEKSWLWHQLENSRIKLHDVEALVQPVAPWQDIQALWSLCCLIRQIGPDLVHCHSSKAGFLGRIAAWVTGTPVVYTVHGWSFTEGIAQKKRRIYRILECLAAHCTNCFICVSEYDKQLGQLSIPAGREKMVTVHNGIKDFFAAKNKKGTESKPVQLVMIARFNEQKDHRLLIRAIATLKKEKILLQVNLVGCGPYLEKMKLLVTQYELQDYIVFLGMRDDIVHILSKQDAFVLVSKWEGFPISILEAMRQGLAVVASDVGGVREAVRDGESGFLIPRGDLQCLTDRLRQICLQPQLRQQMGENGKRFYEQNFTLEKMAQKTFSIYDHVLAETAHAN